MNNTYSKAYTEVLEIINNFSEEEFKKIPQEEIDFYNKNKDANYNFKIDINKDLASQNISRETYAILVSLYRDYFATEKQKQILNNLLQQNQQKLEQEKIEKYNPDNIFNQNEKNLSISNTTSEINEKLLPVETREETWYQKILNFFKSIFKKEN